MSTDRFFLTQNVREGAVNRFGNRIAATVAVRDSTQSSSFSHQYKKAVAWSTDRSVAERIAKMLNDDSSAAAQWSLEARVASLERWRREAELPYEPNFLEGG